MRKATPVTMWDQIQLAGVTVFGLRFYLRAPSDAVDLRERAVQWVQEMQGAARRPHPLLVPCLGKHKWQVGALRLNSSSGPLMHGQIMISARLFKLPITDVFDR